MWAVRKYLYHFERLGHETLATVTIDDVQRFILKVASEVKTSTLHDLFLYLRHFHAFLKEIGEEAPDSVELFSNGVYREMPIQGYVTDEELEHFECDRHFYGSRKTEQSHNPSWSDNGAAGLRHHPFEADGH